MVHHVIPGREVAKRSTVHLFERAGVDTYGIKNPGLVWKIPQCWEDRVSKAAG